MSFIKDKSDLFDNIAVAQTVDVNFPKIKKSSSIPSANSKSKNTIPLMLELQTTLVGTNEISQTLKDFFTDYSKTLEKKVKESIVSNIISSFSCSADFSLPTGNIMQVNIKDLDFFDLMKVNPNTENGRFFYGKPNTDFNSFLYDSIQTGGGSWKGFMNLTVNNNIIDLELTNNYLPKNIKSFITDYTNSFKIIPTETLFTTMVDSLFGAVSRNIDKSFETILEEEKLNKIVDKVLESDPNTDEIIYDDSFFTFTNTENKEIEGLATNRYNGINQSDLVCGLSESVVSDVTFNESFDSVFNSNPVTITNTVSNSIDSLVDESVSDVDDLDRDNVKLNVFIEFLKSLPKILASIIFSPKIIFLFQTVNSLINGGPIDFGNPISLTNSRIEEFVRRGKTFFVDIVRDVYSFIVEFLYGRVKTEILKLVSVLSSTIIKEKLQIYVNILSSLNPLSGLL